MKTIDSLIVLQEQLSEENFQDITEALISELFDRPDLIDDLLKVTTGKTAKQHLQTGASKVTKFIGNKIKDKVLKSKLVKNTIGKREYDNACKELNKAENNYNQAKQNHKNSLDPSMKRVYKADANYYNREANKRAKKVSDIKQKYGI